MELSVGKQSPFPSPGIGEMGIALSITHGILSLTVQLTDVTTEDIQNTNGPIFGFSIYQSPENKIGLVMLSLGIKDIWSLAAPLLAAEGALRRWAENPGDTNILVVVLVDSNNNEIKTIRSVGLPYDAFEILANGIKVTENISFGSIMNHASKIDHPTIWQKGIRWKPDDDGEGEGWERD